MAKEIGLFFIIYIILTTPFAIGAESFSNDGQQAFQKPRATQFLPSYRIYNIAALPISATESASEGLCLNDNQLLCVVGSDLARVQLRIEGNGEINSYVLERYPKQTYGNVYGMNDSGAIIGNVYWADVYSHWAYWGFQGTYETIDFFATDINDNNDITVSRWNPFGHTLYYTRGALINPESGKRIQFPPFGGISYIDIFTQSSAESVNNQGWVVGWADTGPTAQPGEEIREPVIGPAHAFLWKDLNKNEQCDEGEILDIGAYLGENAYSEAIRINDRGVVLGRHYQQGNYGPHKYYFLFSDRNNNFRVEDGEITYLPALNVIPYLTINGMNNSEEICGWIGRVGPGSESIDLFFAFLWKEGIVYDLNDCIPQNLGIHLDEAVDINDRGWILCKPSYLLIPDSSPVPYWQEMR